MEKAVEWKRLRGVLKIGKMNQEHRTIKLGSQFLVNIKSDSILRLIEFERKK